MNIDSALLEIRDLSKSYGATPALREVSLAVPRGEVVCLLGPSGCGKSTLLRIIAGLERQDQGQVLFAGRAVDRLPVHQRGFGLMFQDFALFPHRSVGENVAFGLRMQQLPRGEVERRTAEALELVGLAGYGRRTIYELSGGERQRVALARSLAPRPALLMLDEPLGSLDRTLRERLTEELRELITGLGLTALYVTHDQAEAFTMADTIAVMRAGRIVQRGAPPALYRCPETPFVARFLGLNTLVPGELLGAAGEDALVRTVAGDLRVRHGPRRPAGARVLVVVRPEAAQSAAGAAAAAREQHGAAEVARNQLEVRVLRHTFRGGSERVLVRHAAGLELELDLAPELVAQFAGGPLTLALRPDALSLMAQQEDEA